MLSAEHYVEVTLKPLHAPARQMANNFIIVFVPRSHIKSFREKHQAQEVVIDELIAQALAERLAPDIWQRTGSPSLIEKSRFLLNNFKWLKAAHLTTIATDLGVGFLRNRLIQLRRKAFGFLEALSSKTLKTA